MRLYASGIDGSLRSEPEYDRPSLPSEPEASPATFKGDAFPCDDCGSFSPSPTDVEVVRAMLSKALRLPAHVVDIVFDVAEYWARSTTVLRTLPEACGSTATENSFLLRSYPVGLVNLGGEVTDVPLKAASYASDPVHPAPLGRPVDSGAFAKLAKYPTPRLLNPVRKVVFSVRSKDQGWGGGSTSWTWFEAGLERFEEAERSDDGEGGSKGGGSNQASKKSSRPPPLGALRTVQPETKSDPSSQVHRYDFPLAPREEWLVVRNHLKEGKWRNHVITWSFLDDIDPESERAKTLEKDGRGRATGNGEFVRNLRLGDVVTLWAKARFPGWQNKTMEARIDVYWAV